MEPAGSIGDSPREPACAAVSRVEGAKVTSRSRRDPLQIVWVPAQGPAGAIGNCVGVATGSSKGRQGT